jgi:glycerol-3-phosphate acyltransferase PlsY
MEIFPKFYAFVFGYFCGAIPFGYLLARLRGVNILSVGSGSTGATNVTRTIGHRIGKCVFLLDAGKGFLATAWPRFFLASGAVAEQLAMASFAGALLGHSFSIFLKFRGGKGVSVTVGALAGFMPNVLLLGLLTWGIVFAVTRFVSLASLCFSVVLPLGSWAFGYGRAINVFTCALTLFIILRHGSNVRRLLAGTEYRFGDRDDNGGTADGQTQRRIGR